MMGSNLAMVLLQQAPAGLGAFLPYLLIFVIFYLVLFLPMQRRQKKQKQMLAGLKNGDQVVTNGGIIGTIVKVNDDQTIELRIKPNDVKLLFSRSAVSAMIEQEKK